MSERALPLGACNTPCTIEERSLAMTRKVNETCTPMVCNNNFPLAGRSDEESDTQLHTTLIFRHIEMTTAETQIALAAVNASDT